MGNNIREYALSLLKENGCDLNCYANISYVNGYVRCSGYTEALEDLRTTVSEGANHPFPLEDIANELVAIGNEQPIPERRGHKQFCMEWDTDSCCDGIECDTFEEAKFLAEETYMGWLWEEQSGWKCENGKYYPTPKQIEDYDYMIYNCFCCVVEWDEESGEYGGIDGGYSLTDEELKNIGWVEYAELKALAPELFEEV